MPQDPGVPVTGELVQDSNADLYSTHNDQLGRGGLRVVANEAAMLAITKEKRLDRLGMEVKFPDGSEFKTYELINEPGTDATTISDWQEVVAGVPGDTSLIGSFTPSGTTIGTQYPSTTGVSNGVWSITGLSGDFTYTIGGLNGEAVSNGNGIVYDGSAWTIIEDYQLANLEPYLKKDGSKQIDSSFTPTNDRDLVYKEYVDSNGGDANVKTDWNSTSGDSELLNKPTTISTDQASAIAANTSKETNATHTGEVTGSGALTITDNVIDEANLKLDAAPTNDQVLTSDSTKSGGMKWADAGGGGHVLKENDGADLAQRDNLNFVTNGLKTGIDAVVQDDATSSSTDINLQFEADTDVDMTGKVDTDVSQYNAVTEKWEPGASKVFDEILHNPEANLLANGILSTICPAGYKVSSVTITEQSGNAAGNISIGNIASGGQVVSGETVLASDDIKADLVSDNGVYFSRVNDTPLYISSSLWGSGVITVYFTFLKI